MRLIDADEIRKKAVPHTRGDFGRYNSDIRKWAVLVGDIDDAPTVDAVEVVRCKDCRHFVTPQGVPCYDNFFGLGFPHPSGDDFCSYGERRNDG